MCRIAGKTVYKAFSLKKVDRIRDKWNSILRESGLSRNPTFHSYIDHLNFESIKNSKGSLIISATFTPVRSSPVQFRGDTYRLRIPHQYYEADFTPRSVGDDIAKKENLSGGLVNVRDIPLKLSASMCGLTRYGRNHISYTDRFGSFITLMAFHTEEKEFPGELKEPERMSLCDNCGICSEKCPGAALSGGTFLKVDDCLSLYNEVEGEFPDRIRLMPHNALMGCLLCQEPCPANRDCDAVVDGDPVGEEEAQALFSREISEAGLSGLEKLIGVTDRKSLEDYYRVYSRNFHYAMKEIVRSSQVQGA